ncbi:MAG: hypothetical protein AAF705_01555 [Bacteroidota bacterium]
MKRITSILVLCLLMIGSVLFVVTYDLLELGQTAAQQDSFFTYLENQQVTRLTIESDFSELIDNRDKKIKKDASIRLENEEGILNQFPIQISLRGKSRRELCDFPPLKFRFDDELLNSVGWNAAFDDYKLVTHCLNNSESVLKEFLVYQLYNQLTDYSFKVHVMEVIYVDRNGVMEPVRQYGFFLESYSEMAQRLFAKKMPDQLSSTTKVPKEDYQRLALFQYMIGNTDWNLYRQHNIKWLRIENADIPVPYDFDASGLVNAPYAKPHPSLPIGTVQERFLQYRGGDLQDLDNKRAEIHQKEQAFIRILEECPALSQEEKQEMLNYLGDFFAMGQIAVSNHPQ